jgi:hypothetical protein
MKTKLLFLGIIVTIVLFSCVQKANKDLIIGTWEPIKYDGDKPIASERLVFGTGKTFKIFDGSKEIEPNEKFEYRIINENEITNYPNFKNEDSNGKIISIVLLNSDGSLYTGHNIIGPYEILSLSKEELTLKEVDNRIFKSVKLLNNSAVTFKRLKE